MLHYRKFLQSLEDMTNREMVKACQAAGLVKLGSGSSRVVFAINDKLVIKIALGKAGVSQNETEIQVNAMIDYDFNGYKRYFAKVYTDLCHYKDYFIIMERLDTKFKGRTRYTNLLHHARFNPELIEDKTERALKHYKAAKELDGLMMHVNSDDMHGRNLGMSANGQIKLLDFGLGQKTYRTYYTMFGAGYGGKRCLLK